MKKKIQSYHRPKSPPIAPLKTNEMCSYRFVDHEGNLHTCRAHANCPICNQCTRVVMSHETGHCTGHMGLMAHIPTIRARAEA